MATIENDNDIDMNKNRTSDFTRDDQLEHVLGEINTGIKDSLSPPYSTPKYPIVFIMGCPRSGSTLMLQWLASLGCFVYPSNLIARFYSNPYLGAKIQQALFDFDKGNQIGLQGDHTFSSALGKTNGALNPSEFWYFWRQFFKFGEIQKLSNEALDRVKSAEFLKGLAGLEAAYNRPVAMKGMILNWHIPFLNTLFDKVLFINVEREPFFNAQSLLLARDKFFADRTRWFSYKPPEHETLQRGTPHEQVAGQVYFNRQAVSDGLNHVEAGRKLTVDYKDFCTNPANVYNTIVQKFATMGYKLPADYTGTSLFELQDTIKIRSDEQKQLEQALSHYMF